MASARVRRSCSGSPLVAAIEDEERFFVAALLGMTAGLDDLRSLVRRTLYHSELQPLRAPADFGPAIVQNQFRIFL